MASDSEVGICLSGGGLRAAAFGLGALQALQDQKGLLRGPNSARWLSAVSGGSYVAGAITLINAGTRATRTDGTPLPGTTDLPPGVGPFEPESQETEHVIRHCRYLIEDGGLRTCIRLVGLVVTGIVVLATLIALVGIGLANLAFIAPAAVPTGSLAWSQWLIAAAAVVAYILSLGLELRPEIGWRRRYLFFIIGLVLTCLTAPSLVSRLEALPPLASPSWWTENGSYVGITIAVLAVLPILGFRIRPLRRRAQTLLVLYAWLIPKVVGLLGVTWFVVAISRPFEWGESPWPAVISLGVFLSAAIINAVDLPGRVSPHRPYRDMVARCFAVIRGESGPMAVKPASSISLASLEPDNSGGEHSYPTLLICAAANVSDIGASPAGTNVLPFLISPTTVGIPTSDGAVIDTKKLEKLQRSGALFTRRKEPLLSLPTAIAITGAALAPAMGRMTRGYLRPYLTALNVRLGVWLPNPLNQTVRDAVIREDSNAWSAAGVDEWVLELFGIHRSTAKSLYVSDGGHYENLGLVELVRRKCRTIWCIDASGDRPGRATTLAQALLLAQTVTRAEITIDLKRFDKLDGTTTIAHKPFLHSTHAIGQIRYADDKTGVLIVVKLGLCPESPRMLEEYQFSDQAFPYHPTLNQVYRAERFTAYRSLGWDSTMRCLKDLEGIESRGSGDSPTGRAATSTSREHGQERAPM
jgi:hypothetical protein